VFPGPVLMAQVWYPLCSYGRNYFCHGIDARSNASPQWSELGIVCWCVILLLYVVLIVYIYIYITCVYIYIYIYPIRCATSRHRAFPYIYNGKVTIVALFLGYPKGQNSRPVAMTFGYQNLDFGVTLGLKVCCWRDLFCCWRDLFGVVVALWELLGDGVHFWGVRDKKSSHILESLLAPKISKVAKNHKKTVSRKQSRKSVVPEPPRNGKKLILYTNYNMFREVGHPHFRWLLVSFCLPFGVTFRHFWRKGGIWELKNRGPKKTTKNDEKRSPGPCGGLLVNP